MRLCKVIGTVTLNKCDPSLTGARWKVVVPLTAAELVSGADGGAEPYVVYDEIGCGTGDLVAVSEGAEAAAPFAPDVKPIDGYVAAIMDCVDIRCDSYGKPVN
ncbi:MAG: EutN/CcmL family microcompartment protein [Planctomycetaceae bacterium]|nr:EutN/CcmL family microcompartment protein [Planctomycetaceae bacterium]MCA9045893.1 EutN/CcmL family microcompartment protein [Planctomycetaceae bacterium]MCB9949544.1 EutN/CcmL family microcompartment protein [Planctomycetaceae bacterium]